MICLYVRAFGHWCLVFTCARVDVLTTFNDDHRNSRLIQRWKESIQNGSELINDAHCMNFNENHCFRAKAAMIITGLLLCYYRVSTMLLQSKSSEIVRAATANIRTENLWSLLKITEHLLTLIKISEHYWRCLRTTEDLLKPMVISKKT